MKKLLLFLALLLTACNVKIKGTVKDDHTNQAIPGASVKLDGQQKSVTTQAGDYSLKTRKKKLTRKHQLEVSATSYQPQTQALTSTTHNFRLMKSDVPPPPDMSCDIRQKIAALPDVLKPAEARGEQILKQHPNETIPIGNEFVLKSSQDVLLEKNLDSYILFNPNGEVIWPGALVTRSSVLAGSPALINVPRKNIQVWVSNLSTSSISNSEAVPAGASVTEAVNQIVLANPKGYPAALKYNESEVYSTEQSALKLGVNAKWVGGSADATFSKAADGQYNSVVTQFMQTYYAANFDPPSAGNIDIFQNLTPEICNNVFNTNDPPCYISSVNYGRMMYFKIEAKNSLSEIKAKLRASYEMVNVDAAYQELNTLRETKITAYIKGGSAADGLKAITTHDFLNYIREKPLPSQESPGVPISFVVKDLKGNNLVALQTAAQFTQYNTTPLKRKVRVTLDKLKVWNDGDNVGAGEFMWRILVNGGELDVKGSLNKNDEVSISSGETYSFNGKSIDVEIPYTLSDKLEFRADFTEKDGGLNGDNDVIPTMEDELPITNFQADGQAFERNIRKSKNGDPDVEIWFKYELITTYPAY